MTALWGQMKLQTTLDKVYKQLCAADIFYGHGIEDAWEEAAALVLSVLGLPLDSGDEVMGAVVTEAQHHKIQSLLKQRIEQHIPLAYLIHEAWFMGLPFYVDERVLIPRSPFGEWIEKRFQPWIKPENVRRILEIGTGSGCMAIAASYVFPEAKIDAVDISDDALAVAAQNIKTHAVGERVQLIQSDCFAACGPDTQYDLIISNPPYVSDEEIKALPTEFQYEPVTSALFADNEGMAIVDRILKEAPNYMTTHAILVVEVGYSDEILMAHYPSVPFTWFECEQGGQGIFMLTKQQLEQMAQDNVG